MKRVLIINGPNLNLLGVREPGIYGNSSMDSYLENLHSRYPNYTIEYFQSNHEGEIIDKLHEVGFDATLEGIILNAGAYTHRRRGRFPHLGPSLWWNSRARPSHSARLPEVLICQFLDGKCRMK